MSSVDGSKRNCVYIVSENASLDTNTGAGTHVQTGLTELNKAFAVELVLFCEPYIDSGNHPVIFEKKNAAGVFPSLKKIYGRWLKWWVILFKNHIHFFRYFKLIKKAKPHLIYERAAYLNLNGLIISKLLNIPHYYEVNGLYYKDNASRFATVYNWISKKLEKMAYRSTTGFYVGGLNQELNIPESKKAYVIQNGISKESLAEFSVAKRNVQQTDRRLNLVFVGHMMPHHKLEFLLQALSAMKNKEAVTLHLVGSNFEKLIRDPNEHLNILDHGVLKGSKLRDLLETMDAGIVPFALDYYSNMKLFLYAASQLVMIIPRTRNFKRLFSEREALFFDNGNVLELAGILEKLASHRHEYVPMTENAVKRVEEYYTWPVVFSDVIKVMKSA